MSKSCFVLGVFCSKYTTHYYKIIELWTKNLLTRWMLFFNLFWILAKIFPLIQNGKFVEQMEKHCVCTCILMKFCLRLLNFNEWIDGEARIMEKRKTEQNVYEEILYRINSQHLLPYTNFMRAVLITLPAIFTTQPFSSDLKLGCRKS